MKQTILIYKTLFALSLSMCWFFLGSQKFQLRAFDIYRRCYEIIIK